MVSYMYRCWSEGKKIQEIGWQGMVQESWQGSGFELMMQEKHNYETRKQWSKKESEDSFSYHISQPKAQSN